MSKLLLAILFVSFVDTPAPKAVAGVDREKAYPFGVVCVYQSSDKDNGYIATTDKSGIIVWKEPFPLIKHEGLPQVTFTTFGVTETGGPKYYLVEIRQGKGIVTAFLVEPGKEVCREVFPGPGKK